MDDPLIWVRAVHFAATISVTGVVFFLPLIAEPAFKTAANRESSIVRSRLTWIAWIGLVLVVLSGVAWLVLQTERMADLALADTLREGMIWTVLSGTDFGHDWLARLLLAVVLAATLLWGRSDRAAPRPIPAVACVLAAGLVGTLAWAGHAAGTAGAIGAIHLACDFLHLVAAGAWVGALIPLAILLSRSARQSDAQSAAIAREAVLRFSPLGIASVGTLLATGILNSWVLVGSMTALFGTDYGQMLLVKIALFFAMLCFAAINRLRLTPELLQATNAAARQKASQWIRTNTAAEAVLGTVIVLIVGSLGTMSPIIP